MLVIRSKGPVFPAEKRQVWKKLLMAGYTTSTMLLSGWSVSLVSPTPLCHTLRATRPPVQILFSPLLYFSLEFVGRVAADLSFWELNKLFIARKKRNGASVKSTLEIYYLWKGQENHHLKLEDTLRLCMLENAGGGESPFQLHLGTAQIGM